MGSTKTSTTRKNTMLKKSKPTKSHLKKDAKSFREIDEEASEIKKELKKLKARDKKAKKS